jgi:hypothetical protein
MAHKRVFIAFAIEDEITKYLFTGQAKNKKVPFDFIDMSIKEPYDEKWKTKCRARIRSCDGFIALISKHTENSDGELWEIDCAKEEKIPIFGIYINDSSWINKPINMFWIDCKQWTWDNIKEFIESL